MYGNIQNPSNFSLRNSNLNDHLWFIDCDGMQYNDFYRPMIFKRIDKLVILHNIIKFSFIITNF